MLLMFRLALLFLGLWVKQKGPNLSLALTLLMLGFASLI